MPEPITLTISVALLGSLTDAVFSYALEESGLGEKVRAWLGKDPARLAYQTALARAFDRFAHEHPEWAASLLDEQFLRQDSVARELGRFLTRRDQPDSQTLAQVWAEQLGEVGRRHREDAAKALADFLRILEEELGNQEALRALFDSRALARMAANTQTLAEELRALRDQALAACNASVRIAGDLHNALIVTGDRNVIHYFVERARPLRSDYVVWVEESLQEYLGTEEQPVPFGGREDELRTLSEWLDDVDAPPYLLLTAPAGRGKSALLVRWAAGLRGRQDVDMVFVPVSIRFHTNLYEVTFTLLAAHLAQIYDKEPPGRDETPEMWRAFVTQTLREPPPDGRRVLVILDGVDEAADWQPDAGLFPAQLGPGVRVVASARLTATRPTPRDWLRAFHWDGSGRARSLELVGWI